jgi:hypothetical protein
MTGANPAICFLCKRTCPFARLGRFIKEKIFFLVSFARPFFVDDNDTIRQWLPSLSIRAKRSSHFVYLGTFWLCVHTWNVQYGFMYMERPNNDIYSIGTKLCINYIPNYTAKFRSIIK